jgi:antitoxin component YwqK of YwqJK toxin-antitoxin module
LSYWLNTADYGDVRHEIEQDWKGIYHGSNKKYNSKGILIESMELCQGQINGKWCQYTNEGIIRNYSTFTHGDKNGAAMSYYKDGTPRKYSYYVNNARHGLVVSYREDGTIWRKRTYAHDKLHGVAFEYLATGESILTEYAQGVFQGKNICWWPSGGRKYEHNYFKGQWHGRWITWTELGHPSKTLHYDRDKSIN